MAKILMPDSPTPLLSPDREIWSLSACSVTRRTLDVTAKFKCLAKQDWWMENNACVFISQRLNVCDTKLAILALELLI